MTSCQKVSLSKKMKIIEVFDQEFGVNTMKSWSCGHLGGMASIHMEALDGTVQFLVSGRMGMLGNGPRVPVIAHITSFVKGVSKYKFYCCPKFDILILKLFQHVARFGKFWVRHRWRQHYFQILLELLLVVIVFLTLHLPSFARTFCCYFILFPKIAGIIVPWRGFLCFSVFSLVENKGCNLFYHPLNFHPPLPNAPTFAQKSSKSHTDFLPFRTDFYPLTHSCFKVA